MKSEIKNKIQKGFTIIEVMIVLAIAGVIIMMVFLAIPALQRNNRNTQIRNDAASVLGYVNEYSTNKNGALPLYINADVTNGKVSMGANADSASVVGVIRSGVKVTNGTTMPADTGEIAIALNSKCNSDGSGLETGNVNRAYAAMFQVETAGGSTSQCQQS